MAPRRNPDLVRLIKFKEGDRVQVTEDDGTTHKGTVVWCGHDGPKPWGLEVIEYARVQWDDGDADTFIDEEI